MKRTKIEGSSQIKEVGYDENSQTLEVMFQGGVIYHYTGVPTVTAEGLMNAESPGKYFNANIRGVFQYEKVS